MDKLPTESFARSLRVVATFIAISSVLWEAVDFFSGSLALTELLLVRAATVVAAAVIAMTSTAARSVLTLQRLAFTLALTVAVAVQVASVLDPEQAWSGIAILTAVVLGAALFLPWPWRWQALLAGVIAAGTLGTLILGVPRAAFPARDIILAGAELIAIGVGSAVGSALAERERRRLAHSESLYRSLFQSAGDAIAVLDTDGVIREANRRFGELLGVRVDGVIGLRLRDFYAPFDSGAAAATQERAAALSGEVGHAAQVLVRGDGTPLEVEFTFARSEGPNGPIVQAILRDITERRTLERRQVQEERLDSLARFAGGIAHQFNNILGGILTHASLLRTDATNQANAQELDEILHEARRGRDLTKELLRFTRHEVIVLRPTAVAALVESVAALARATLPHDVAIDVRVPENLPAVLGDEDHLVHAALQVVLNARDAMAGRPDSRLTLSAGLETVRRDDSQWPALPAGTYVRISIGNNGPAMDAATIERAFEPFFTTKPMHQAAGIGLATVRGVMRDHRGAARLESAPGRGTILHLLVPIAPGEATGVVVAPPVAAPATGAGGGATILVVDDEAIVRNSLRRALNRFGYNVLEAGDGGTALAQLQAAQPPVDLVILDLVLPGGGSGVFEILKSVRPDLRVLVSSGYAPDAENAKALAAKAQGFLAKPYEIKELRDAVARALAAPL